MTESEAQVQIKSIPDKIWMQISKDDKEAIKMAYMALEKQVPKKVERIGCTQSRCSCGAIIRLSKYCRYCGQKLDWSDKNEID